MGHHGGPTVHVQRSEKHLPSLQRAAAEQARHRHQPGPTGEARPTHGEGERDLYADVALIKHLKSDWLFRWTVLKCGRNLCQSSDWPSRFWTRWRSVVPEASWSGRPRGGESVNLRVMSRRSSPSTRTWAVRRRTPTWSYRSTPRAPFCWQSRPSTTSKKFTNWDGGTHLSNTRTVSFYRIRHVYCQVNGIHITRNWTVIVH